MTPMTQQRNEALFMRFPGGGDTSTIFIDVIGLDIAAGADLILSLRKALPEMVVVHYIDRSAAELSREEFYKGERARFSHDYALDKRTPAAAFSEELRAVLATFVHDLSWRLSETSLERLRGSFVIFDFGKIDQKRIRSRGPVVSQP